MLTQHPFSSGEAGLVVGPLSIAKHPPTSDRPETFRLPIKGGDPYFGLTRGWYYAAEKDGLIRLVRLRKRGNRRGVTLVPYDDVAALIAAAKLG